MSENKAAMEEIRIKKEPGSDSQYVEADSSTNSTATTSAAGEATTRQSSLQRIQLRKEKVGLKFVGALEGVCSE